MESAENKGFSRFSRPMGWNVASKSAVSLKKANEIKGFMHNSYGMAVNLSQDLSIPSAASVMSLGRSHDDS